MHVGPFRTHFRVHVDSYTVPFLLLPTIYITWPLIAVVYCLMLHFIIYTEPTIDDGGFFFLHGLILVEPIKMSIFE